VHHYAVITSAGNLDSVDTNGFKVLNMLNTKWVILPSQEGANIPVENPHAMGNAWFVDEILFVNNADEEIEVLGSIDLSSVAVADKKYEPILDNFKQGFRPAKADSASTIMLTDYDSDFLIYSVDAKKDELAIFSEVYYPKGWQITIDGEPAEMLRANYTLRALPIPQGKHTVEFRFDPESIKVTDRIAYGALLIMLLTAVVIFINAIKRNKTKIKKDY
jgi:hypothetical protein